MDKPRPLVHKVGAVSVPIYHYGDGRWAIVYRETRGGKRKTVSCRSEADARKQANTICLQIARGQLSADRLSIEQRMQAVEAGRLLAPLGLSLDGVAREVAAAHELTGGAGVAEMARFWARHHHSATTSRTPALVLEEMMAAKKSQDLDDEYQRITRLRLVKFAAAFPRPIAEIDAKQIRAYLGDLSGNAVTRNKTLASIVMLFRFARGAKDLPHDRTVEAELVGRVKESKKPPRVYTALELSRWLEVVRPEWLPWLVLGSFAGIRSEEIGKMDWSDIQWITNEIFVRPEVSKTGEGRYVPMQPNLVQWLLPHRKGTGSFFPEEGQPRNETQRMAAILKQPWKRNAPRHSYGSHRLGIIRDLAKLTVGSNPTAGANAQHAGIEVFVEVLWPKKAPLPAKLPAVRAGFQ